MPALPPPLNTPLHPPTPINIQGGEQKIILRMHVNADPPPKKKELVAYYNSLIHNCALHLCNPPPLLGRLSIISWLLLRQTPWLKWRALKSSLYLYL